MPGFDGTAVAPDGKRYPTNDSHLSLPFPERFVARVAGDLEEGAVPTVNEFGYPEWIVPDGEGGGGGVSSPSAVDVTVDSGDWTVISDAAGI